MNPLGPVLILGATSDIARATARVYAEQGCRLILAARSTETLEADANDLRLRYTIDVDLRRLDILDTASHAAFIDSLPTPPQTIICAIGLLAPQAATETDPALAETIMRTNYLGPALLFDRFATIMETAGTGTLIGISSVAGDRGRASNYCYGAAKAGFSAYLSGLRNRCSKKGVAIITVKPGFVRTRMTQGMDLPPALTATPEEVARAILKAQQNGSHIIYVRWIWWPIMTIIRLLPEFIFKQLSL